MDTRIGCKRDARKAVRGELEYLSQGAYRLAYCDTRRKVVYKVEIGADAGVGFGNRREAEVASRARRQGAKCITPTTLWRVRHNGMAFDVVAQPMMAKLGRDVWNEDPDKASLIEDELYEIASELGIGDIHDRNWMLDDAGDPYIVDMGL